MRLTRHIAIRPPSKPTIFTLLMAAALVAMILPGDLLEPARKLTQFIAPLQMATHSVTLEARRAVDHVREPTVSPDQYDDLMRNGQMLANENAALRQQNARLQATIDELTGLNDQGLPGGGVLIPARVIAMDAAPGRESLVVTKGQRASVKPDDWVVTALKVDAGSADGVVEASVVLARQCLIGWVEQTTPYTSRVVLLSDRAAGKPRKVYLDGADGVPRAFVLEGAGAGRMRIPDVPADLVDSGLIATGCLVTSDPDDAHLRRPIVIGEIVELRLNRDNPVYYDAIVAYPYDPRDLGQVFIADFSRTATASPR